MARFIDRTNILEFFECAVEPEPPLKQDSHLIYKIYFGRMYATQWLYRLEAVKKNKKLFESFKNMAEMYRGLVSNKIGVRLMEEELRQMRLKNSQAEEYLKDLISKAAFTYTAIENPSCRPDLVISGSPDITAKMRETLYNNARL